MTGCALGTALAGVAITACAEYRPHFLCRQRSGARSARVVFAGAAGSAPVAPSAVYARGLRRLHQLQA